MYAPSPTTDKPANGFDISNFVASQTVEIWPENFESVDLFSQLSTQWRVGFNGKTGLDYNVLFRLLDEMNVSSAAWREFFADIRIMEAEALESMRNTN